MKAILTFFVSLVTLSLSGQISMFVHQNNSSTDIYNIDDVRKITFDNGMNVYPHTGITTNYVIDDVRKITFENGVLTSDRIIDETSVSFRTYPNPATDLVNVEYKLSFESRVFLEVYNINGKLVSFLDIGKRSAGSHYVQWLNEHKLTTGIYILKLKTDEFIKTNRLVIQSN